MILSRSEESVTVLVLNRPEKRNAMTPAMLEDLRRAIAAAAHSSRAIVLAGEGKVFCGGFDLKMCLDQPGTLESLLRGLHAVIQDLRALPVPVVIAAHGAAIAGGCALLGGADVVITDAGAKLGYPVVPLGISPAISAPFLRLLVGDGPARGLLLDPALVSGREAARLGLAHECVAQPGEVLPRAIEIARDLASKPAGAMSVTRAWLHEIEDRLGGDDHESALRASLSLVGSAEERSRLAALLGAREP